MNRTPLELLDACPEGFMTGRIVDEYRERFASMQVFDFGDISDVRMGTGPAIDLWKSGILKLPFQSVMYRFAYRKLHVYIAAAQIENNVGMYMWRDDKHIDDPRLYLDLVQEFTLEEENVALTVIYNDRTTDSDGNEIDRKMLNQYVGFWASCVIHLSMMLCTRNIGKRHVPAPVRLNKKRARTGKRPIPAVTYVDVSPYRSGDGPRIGTGLGIGKSPHLRRGHVRHFDDGTKTWVKDCVVNMEVGDEPIKRDHYKVTQGESKC